MNREMEIYLRLYSIGINVSTKKKRYEFTDIEKTLTLACEYLTEDKRILSLLLSWIETHGARVNVERLRKISADEKAAWISLLAHFAIDCGFNRWKVLISRPKKEMANGQIELAKSRIALKGEEKWSKGTGFLIPKGSEPISEKYILGPSQLATVNQHYKNKLIYGYNWRADIITAIQAGAENAFQAAKISQASYEPAYRVCSDLKLAGVLKDAEFVFKRGDFKAVGY